MALDGIVIANIVHDLNKELSGGRINKIAQPEKDELLFQLRGTTGQNRLLISVSASLPLIYFTDSNKPSPITAPNFCMLLRKHLNGARILSVTQVDFERVVDFTIEHLNEMGDLCIKHLMVELMGKHSNIIFCDDEHTIIDSIKHIPASVSSVREVLPGRPYFIPNTQVKVNPLTISKEQFYEHVLQAPYAISKAIYMHLTGFSPLIANELCSRSGCDGDMPTQGLSSTEKDNLYEEYIKLCKQIQSGEFEPNIVYNGQVPVEFSSVTLSMYSDYTNQSLKNISEVLENFYSSKDVITRIRQKSSDLRRIVTTALERNRKKYDLQAKQLKDTDKRDKYKVYGELLHTYGYSAKPGDTSITCMNYYDNKEITIPLDRNLTAGENAEKYFNRYNKLKRTYEALCVQTKDTSEEIEHLESIATALDIARKAEDLQAIKDELVQCGYIHQKYQGKKKAKTGVKSSPLHFISSDGYDIYVGKNNFQNDQLTFEFATGNDWWFHAKKMAGSHVIVKSKGETELPDRVFEEAGRLAAYFSKGRGSDKVEIDYVQKKQVKKPNGSKPGFVVYYTNYSLVAPANIDGINLADDKDKVFLERSFL